MSNKIKYGLSHVYYAKGSEGANHTLTYDTPVAIEGAINLSVDAQGDNITFYADNVSYWVGNGNNGYSGTLEIARVPESFKKDILGLIEDNTGLLVESMDAPIVHFALTFQFEGDENATRHVLYNCTVSRPQIAGATKNESIEPQTETLNIEAKSIYFASLDAEIVKAECPYSSSSYTTWNTAIVTPVAKSTST